MSYLVDTSVLGRLANRWDTFYPIAVNALAELHRRGETVFICPQNLIEFRNFATRPRTVNGLGMTIASAVMKAAQFESSFSLLPETPAIFPAWKAIAHAAAAAGKQVHDTRLIAICDQFGVANLLTFNLSHFTRLAAFVPGVTIVDPATVK